MLAKLEKGCIYEIVPQDDDVFCGGTYAVVIKENKRMEMVWVLACNFVGSQLSFRTDRVGYIDKKVFIEKVGSVDKKMFADMETIANDLIKTLDMHMREYNMKSQERYKDTDEVHITECYYDPRVGFIDASENEVT